MPDIPQDALDAARQLRKKIDADPRTYETDAERDAEWDQIVAAALVAYAEKRVAEAKKPRIVERVPFEVTDD